jgi:hypothetical protein
MIPDDYALILFKFGINKHIIDLQNGNMFFSCAGNYVHIAKNKGNDEQGDKEEGIFARLYKSDKRINMYKEKFGPDLETIQDNDFMKLRRKSSLYYPLFCLYAFTAKDVLNSGEVKVGVHEYTFRFNEKIFEAFSQARSVRCCLNKDFLPAISYLQPKPFLDNVKVSLFNSNCDFRIDKIDYSQKASEEYCIDPDNRRSELFYKNPKYEYQHETRICILNKKFNSIFGTEIIKLFPFAQDDFILILNYTYITVIKCLS